MSSAAAEPAGWLARVPVFGALRDDALELLLAHAETRTVAAGAWFFREGDEADAMYVLQAGEVAVEKGWFSRTIELHRLAAGDCFGELALMDPGPRSASIRALADCRAIAITPGTMHRLFEHDAEQFALLQMNIGREVCRRLRAADDALFLLRVGGKLPRVA